MRDSHTILPALFALASTALTAQPDPHPGDSIYEAQCAVCHDGTNPRAPALDTLRSFNRETLSYTLTAGVMSAQGMNLSDADRAAVVDYLAADPLSSDWIDSNLCAADQRSPDFSGLSTPTPGVDARFSRHLRPEQGGLTTADMSTLEIAWALGIPGASGIRSAPAIAGDTLFFPAAVTGQLLAIDVESGCIRWTYDAGAPLRASAALADPLDEQRVFMTINDPVFSSRSADISQAGIYAFDIATGKPVWFHRAQPDCEQGRGERVVGCERRYGFSALPLVIDGTVVAGSLDGRLFVFSAVTGEILYQLDTAQEFASVNGVAAHGGSIDSQAITAGAGMLFVGSGYARFGQQAGNLLLGLRLAKSPADLVQTE